MLLDAPSSTTSNMTSSHPPVPAPNNSTDAALHLLCLAAEANHNPPHLSHPLPRQQQQQQQQQQQHPLHHHHPPYPFYLAAAQPPSPAPHPHYHQSSPYLYHPIHYTTTPVIHSFPYHHPHHQLQPQPQLPQQHPPQQPQQQHLDQQQQQQQQQQPQTPPMLSHLSYSHLFPSHSSPVLPGTLPVTPQTPLSPIQPHPVVQKVKGPWRPEEDQILTQLVSKLGPRRWTVIASHIPGRMGKQARERWLNQLSPHLAKRPWTPEEDRIVMDAHARLGNRWSEIAKLLNGRTDNATKNRFNTTIRRQISELSTHAREEFVAGVKKTEGVATSMVTSASKTTTPTGSPNVSDTENDMKIGLKRKREATSRVIEPIGQRPKTVTASS